MHNTKKSKELNSLFPDSDIVKVSKQKDKIIENKKFNRLQNIVHTELENTTNAVKDISTKGVSINNLPTVQKVEDIVKEKKVSIINYEELSKAFKAQLIEALPLDVIIKNLELDVKNFPNGFEITNLPVEQLIKGDVNISNLPDIQKIKGKVDIDFPDVQKVKINFPKKQEVTGKVQADVTFPETQQVTIKNFPITQKVTGEVKVEFPETQKVDVINDVTVKGKVSIDFPNIQKVEITNVKDLGSVKVSNLPKTQKIEGSVKLTPERDPKNYVPVRLTNGQKWIEQFVEAVGGGFYSSDTFQNSDKSKNIALIDDDGHVQVDVLTLPDVTLNVGDIEIGAVELKDGTSDTRVKVKDDGTDNAVVVTQNSQPLPSGASTSAKQLPDNHNVTVSNPTADPETGLAKEVTLQTISNIDFATEAAQDDILTELQNIKFYDADNSTSTPLGANATFTGDWVDTNGYIQAIVIFVTDQDAATDGFKLELSNDGVNVDHYHAFSPLANTPAGHHYPSVLGCRYFRIRYTNGSTPQGTFKIITNYLKYMAEEGHVHAVEYEIDADHPAPIRRSVLVAKNPSGTYGNINRTTGGNLKTSVEEIETEVSEQLNLYPVGTGSNGSVTLTDADTAYAIPSSAPTGSYKINIDNQSDTSIYIGYANSNANGIELPPGDVLEDELGADEQLYAYCGSSGKVLTYSYKEIN